VEDLAPSVLDGEESVEYLEGQRRHGEEVEGDDDLTEIVKKPSHRLAGSPGRRMRRRYRATLRSETAKPSRAIGNGERDARRLAQLRDGRCGKSEEEIAEQLSGHWRDDYLFSLKQALKMYDAIQKQIAEYEREILARMAQMEREGESGAGSAEAE
jgi:hypothetical protein